MFLVTEGIHRIHQIIHVLMLYILFQDAKSAHSHGMWCSMLLFLYLQVIACSSLQTSLVKLTSFKSLWIPGGLAFDSLC